MNSVKHWEAIDNISPRVILAIVVFAAVSVLFSIILIGQKLNLENSSILVPPPPVPSLVDIFAPVEGSTISSITTVTLVHPENYHPVRLQMFVDEREVHPENDVPASVLQNQANKSAAMIRDFDGKKIITFILDTTKFANGKHSLMFVIVDKEGNTQTAAVSTNVQN